MLNDEIVKIAREWKGTPFHHQGRAKGIGVDCAGLIIGIAHELGLSNYDYTEYGRLPDSQRMKKILDGNLDRIKIEDAKQGDILHMKIAGRPQHLAILTKDNTIIHAYLTAGKCVEHNLNEMWRRRIVAAYRYK